MNKKTIISRILGLFFPGLGYAYKGKITLAIIVFILTIVLYLIYIPLGIIAHTVSFSDTIIDKKKIKKENLYLFS